MVALRQRHDGWAAPLTLAPLRRFAPSSATLSPEGRGPDCKLGASCRTSDEDTGVGARAENADGRALGADGLETKLRLQRVDTLAGFGLGEVLAVRFRLVGFLTQRLEVAGLCAGHRFVAAHPIVGV